MFQAVQAGRENPPLFSVFPCLILSPPNRKMGQVEIKKRRELGQSLQGMRGTSQLGPPLEAASLPQGAGAWVFQGKAGPSDLGAPNLHSHLWPERRQEYLGSTSALVRGSKGAEGTLKCPVPSSYWLDPTPLRLQSKCNSLETSSSLQAAGVTPAVTVVRVSPLVNIRHAGGGRGPRQPRRHLPGRRHQCQKHSGFARKRIPQCGWSQEWA